MSGEPTLILLSGLGADRRLLRPQESLPLRVVILDWIEHRRRDTLATYGRRLIDRIDVAPPFFLGGVSMGAMLALEMSRWVNPEAVFLISGARSNREIRPLLRVLGRFVGTAPLWGKTPPLVTRPLGAFIAKHLLFSHGQLTRGIREACAEMGRDCSPSFVRWGCRATTTWPGAENGRAPVYHIHGENDRVFPLRRVRPDYVVRGGSHLINLTHAEEVNAYLREKIETHLEKL